MSLVVQSADLLDQLNMLTSSWSGVRKIGLYQNDWSPERDSTIEHVEECTFAGYDGSHDLLGWSGAAMLGDSAVSYATPRLWTYNGDPPSGWVVGYFVTDSGGRLVWAERLPTGPVALVTAGQTFELTPAFALRSRYP